jgi:hypothetical protein
LEPIPRLLQDRRCAVGTKITDGESLFEVVDTRISGSSIVTARFWVVVEDCSTLARGEVEAELVLDAYELVCDGVVVPDYAPREAAA